MRKYELAAALARRFGYQCYLEVCTPTTGGGYAQVDAGRFPRRRRLMYRCPPDFSDGSPIDFRTEADSSAGLFQQLHELGERFDLVFVDPWHTYEASQRDLAEGLKLVRPGGALLVHDCDPPERNWASPEPLEGAWCGVTYVAWLDLMWSDPALGYVTVDTDYGCGIAGDQKNLESLWKGSSGSWFTRLFGHKQAAAIDPDLRRQWTQLPLAEKYPFFAQHRRTLLRQISVDEFCRRVDFGRPGVLPAGAHR